MGSPERVRELDGLRGIAILMVIFYHFLPAKGPLTVLDPLLHLGWVGVDLFFVLSGYLITGILVDTRGEEGWYRRFIVRRVLRIFPLYYAALAFEAVVSYYPAHVNWHEFLTAKGGWWYIAYAANVKNFLDNSFASLWIMTPLWSLSVEEQFYLVFPLFVALLSRKALTRALLVAVPGAFLIRALLVMAMPHNLLATFTLTPSRMDGLAIGGLIAIAQRDFPHVLRQRWIAWATMAGFALFLATESPDGSGWAMRTVGFSSIDIAFGGLLIMAANWKVRPLAAVCRWPVLTWIGTISYGIYILHLPMSVIVERIAGPGMTVRGTADVFVSAGAAIAAAWLSWTFFESPILRLKERLAPRRTRTEATISAAL